MERLRDREKHCCYMNDRVSRSFPVYFSTWRQLVCDQGRSQLSWILGCLGPDLQNISR